MKSVTITVVEEISANKYILKCACCDGSGTMSKYHDNCSPYIPCTVCNGKGVVLVEIDGSTPFVKCQLCNGSGEQSKYCDNHGPYIICTRCNGVGAQPLVGSLRLIR